MKQPVNHQVSLSSANCSGENWAETFEKLDKYLPALKKSLGSNKELGVGLKLTGHASRDLLQKGKLEAFKSWLTDNNIYITNINGTIYSYDKNINPVEPDWTDDKRRTYTKRLFRIIKFIKNENTKAGIITNGIYYKPWLNTFQKNKTLIYQEAAVKLINIVKDLFNLYNEQGKFITIQLTPAPSTMLENTSDIVQFFESWLIPVAKESWKIFPKTEDVTLEGTIKNFIRICINTGDFATSFEDFFNAATLLKKKNIKIGNIQLSSVPEIDLNDINSTKKAIIYNKLYDLNQKYPFQSAKLLEKDQIIHYNTIAELLNNFNTLKNGKVRLNIHYTPFHLDYEVISTTIYDVKKVLEINKKLQLTPNLEIENNEPYLLSSDSKKNNIIYENLKKTMEWILEEIN